jgi:hypothetical protein
VTLGTVGNRESLAAVFTGPPVELARELLERARRSHGGLLIADATRRALDGGAAAALREAGALEFAGGLVPIFELPPAP